MSSAYDEGVAAAMRESLAIFEQHPELGIMNASYSGLSMFFHGDTAKTELDTARRTLALGTWEKQYTDDYLILRSKTASGVKVGLYADRDKVCEQVVTGKKTEEQESMVCPECDGNIVADGEGGMVCAVNGRKDYYARPLKKLVKLVEVDKTEWVCSPALETKHDLAVTS